MGRALWPVLVAIAIVVLIPPNTPSQPPALRNRDYSSDEIQQLKKQYIKLRTELKSRRMLKSILEVDEHIDLTYLKSQYGIQRLPELSNVSDESLFQRLRDLRQSFHIIPMMYGEDDLQEVYRDIPEEPATNVPFVEDDRVLKASKSVVAIISRDSMVYADGSWTLKTTPLTDVLGGTLQLCDFDRFYNAQYADVRGTGFLVEDSVIATAGHLVQVGVNGYTDWLESVYFVFEYVMQAEGVVKTTFKEDEVYTGIEVLADHASEGADWALIKLDRPVTGRDPLPCRKYGKVDGTTSRVYMLGHPHGMPMKYSGPAAILNNEACHYFLSNLDTHPCNSGSPVFNDQDHMVEGILARDVGNFAEFCECYASAVYTSQMGIAGAEVTRSILFKRFLEWPDHVFIESTIPTAIVKTTTSEGLEFFTTIRGETIAELPYSDTGVLLLGNVDDCWIPYFPQPGELWKVVPSSYAGMNAMEKVCE